MSLRKDFLANSFSRPLSSNLQKIYFLRSIRRFVSELIEYTCMNTQKSREITSLPTAKTCLQHPQLASPSKFCWWRFFFLRPLIFISIHLFQSDQRSQAIEFVDLPVPEKLDIFRTDLS